MAPNGPATPPTPTVDSGSVRKGKAEAGFPTLPCDVTWSVEVKGDWG